MLRERRGAYRVVVKLEQMLGGQARVNRDRVRRRCPGKRGERLPGQGGVGDRHADTHRSRACGEAVVADRGAGHVVVARSGRVGCRRTAAVTEDVRERSSLKQRVPKRLAGEDRLVVDRRLRLCSAERYVRYADGRGRRGPDPALVGDRDRGSHLRRHRPGVVRVDVVGVRRPRCCLDRVNLHPQSPGTRRAARLPVVGHVERDDLARRVRGQRELAHRAARPSEAGVVDEHPQRQRVRCRGRSNPARGACDRDRHGLTCRSILDRRRRHPLAEVPADRVGHSQRRYSADDGHLPTHRSVVPYNISTITYSNNLS